MTSLDRAFIKAYNGSFSLGVSAPAAPAPQLPVLAEVVPDAEPTSAATSHRSTSKSVGAPWAAQVAASSLGKASAAAGGRRHGAAFDVRGAVKNPETLKATVEIDELAWPKEITELLESARRGWDRFADMLCERIARGEKCIALASCSSGEGATTLTLTTAKLLAERGLRSVMVDANFEHPDLAQACGITPHAGWTDAVDGTRPLAETLISATADGVALLPCHGRTRQPQPANSLRLATTFETLKEQFDLVLVDAAPLGSQTELTNFVNLAQAIGINAVYLVNDPRTTSGDVLGTTTSRLSRTTIPLAGIIENFAPQTAADRSLRDKLPEFVSRWLDKRG